MATVTTNYGLTKPAPEDFYDIAVHNGNMEIIDAELKKVANNAASSGFVSGFISNVSSADDLDTKLDAIIAGMSDGKMKFIMASFSVAHPVLGGANRIFRIDRITNIYSVIHSIAYTNDGAGVALEYVRSKFNGTWTSWARNYNTHFKPTAADIGAAPNGLVKDFASVETEVQINSAIENFIGKTKDNTQQVFLLEVTLTSVIPSDLYFITIRRHTESVITVSGFGVVSTGANNIERRKIGGVWSDWKIVSSGVLDASLE